ncbi:hypothetical protein, partial [Verrucomicrobium spinosum]|uniref:hypothetical protein n=1 Tax=Verrucomicrobium spinosum TaxID=2736 RepID=UPI001C48788D
VTPEAAADLITLKSRMRFLAPLPKPVGTTGLRPGRQLNVVQSFSPVLGDVGSATEQAEACDYFAAPGSILLGTWACSTGKHCRRFRGTHR